LLIIKGRKWIDDRITEELVEMVRREQKMIDGFLDKLGA
jgi:hypothetical protein